MKSQLKENQPATAVEYKISNGDCLRVLKNYDDGQFDLIVTSPPYNVGKSYEVKTSIEQYLETQEEIIKELVRTLSLRGNLCWQVGNFVDKGEVFPLDIFYYQIFKKHGLKLRNRIVWHFRHGLHAGSRFSGRYETILWFSKSDNYIFNLDPVRIPSKYPGKRHFKGPKKGKPSGNPLGKNPSDVWEIGVNELDVWDPKADFISSLCWDMPNVKANHPEKTEHPCQYPVELVERCVLALSNNNSWVLDPFGGVGSTVVAAIKNNRNAIAIERDKRYCKIAKKRVRAYLANKLKLRPITQQIHKPGGNDKVAQIPEEWLESQLHEVPIKISETYSADAECLICSS